MQSLGVTAPGDSAPSLPLACLTQLARPAHHTLAKAPAQRVHRPVQLGLELERAMRGGTTMACGQRRRASAMAMALPTPNGRAA